MRVGGQGLATGGSRQNLDDGQSGNIGGTYDPQTLIGNVRVSTATQGRSGLGIEAQRQALGYFYFEDEPGCARRPSC